MKLIDFLDLFDDATESRIFTEKGEAVSLADISNRFAYLEEAKRVKIADDTLYITIGGENDNNYPVSVND